MTDRREGRSSDEVMPQSLQEMLLALLVFSDSSGAAAASRLTSDHFDGVYRDVAAAALDFRTRYGRPPGRAHAEDLLLARQPRGGSQRASRILRQLEARAGEVNPDYAARRASEHVRRTAIKSALVEAGERYYGPLEGSVDDMEAVLYRALRSRDEAGEGGVTLSDVVRTMPFLERPDAGIPLGIPALDAIGVGLVPGKLLLYLAGKGTGKSWFCVHAGRQTLMQGKRVIHVSCGEMDEEDVGQRYVQNFFAVASNEDRFPVTTLKLDEVGRAVGWDRTRYRSPKRVHLRDPRIRSYIASEARSWGTRLDNLVIKRFSGMTIDRLRGYLDYLEHAHGFVPSTLIVDYPDLMALPARDYRVALGRAYVALKDLGSERGMAVVAPTQTNRAGWGAERTSTSMVSEDKTKVDTADYVLSYSRTSAEKKRGLARLCLEHSRGTPDGHVIVIVQSYPTGQYVMRSALQAASYWSAVRDDDETRPRVGRG